MEIKQRLAVRKLSKPSITKKPMHKYIAEIRYSLSKFTRSATESCTEFVK
jgi:hypothetical protein